MATIAKIIPTTKVNIIIVESVLFPVSLVLTAYTVLLRAFSMAFLAPTHEPGPIKRYCEGVQGPNKHLKASTGSLRNNFIKLGLHPIISASSSQYGM